MINAVRGHLRVHFQSLAALAIRGLSVLAGFAVTFVIGRTMGPAANGQYALVTQTGMFLSVVAVGGLDMAVVRHFSAAVARKIPISRASFGRALVWSLGFSGLIIAALAIGGKPLTILVMTAAAPAGALVCLSLILVSRSMTRMMSAVLRSQRAFILGQSIEVLVIPSLVVLALVAGFAGTVDEVLWITAIAGLATGVFAIGASLSYTSSRDGSLDVTARQLMKSAIPLWGVSISLNVADWYSLTTAATMLGIAEAGLYRVAFQVGSALSIVGLGLFSVFSPQIGAAHAAGDRVRIGKLTRSATRLSTVFVLPLTLVVFVFAEPILGLFGPAFPSAANALRIVVTGQALYSITGPAGLTLAMTGHEKTNFAIASIGTGLLFLMAPLGAWLGGLTGLALGVTLALAGRITANMIAVHRLEGINVITGRVRVPLEPKP